MISIWQKGPYLSVMSFISRRDAHIITPCACRCLVQCLGKSKANEVEGRRRLIYASVTYYFALLSKRPYLETIFNCACSVIHTNMFTFIVVQLRKLSLKKIQASTGFEPMTSAIPVQRSTN